MANEDAAVASITIKGTAELSDRGRRLYPARPFRIELSQLLKFEIFFLRQEVYTHGRRHAHRATLWLMFLLRRQRPIVIAKTDAITGSLGRAIDKNVFARFFIVTGHIRFAAGSLHLTKRPQFFRIRFQPCLYLRPGEILVAVHVFLKTSPQSFEQFFPLSG